METRFGVRPYPNSGSDSYEVVDRMTGTTVASGMRRVEAEDDARRRNHGDTGPPALAGFLDPAEVAGLRAAVDACLARAGRHSRILVARAAEALDDLREEFAHADSLIAEQQARIGKLYNLFTGSEGASG